MTSTSVCSMSENYVTRPAEQVQYWNIFVPLHTVCHLMMVNICMKVSWRNLNTFLSYIAEMVTGSFLGIFWGQMLAPSQSKNEQKLPKVVNNSLNFLSCTVWGKFHENPTRISKVTDVYIHTLMHIFVSNNKGQCNYTDIYYGFKSDNLKWRSRSFRPNLNVLNFDGSNGNFPNSTGPWPWLR